MTFTVNNFQNPYNGIPKSGFQIITYEATGLGMVDRSDSLSVTTNVFSTIENPTITRADTVRTVGEQSSLTFTFQLNLPVDAKCMLRVIFPDDQPPTFALKTASGTNLLSSVSGLTTLNIANNLIEVTGCSAYSEATNSFNPSTLTVAAIVNKGWVANTDVFKFEMYAIDSDGLTQRIAETTSKSLIISTDTTDYTKSMLVPGGMNYFTISAEDSTAVGYWTRYKVTFTPVHSIPASNKIIIKFPTGIEGIALNAVDSSNPCSISGTSGGMSQLATCSIDTTNNELTITNAFGSTGTFTSGGAALSFIFSTGGTNPGKACQAGNFIVRTFATLSNVDYPIDYYEFDAKVDPTTKFVPYVPTAAVLTASVGTPTSTIASAKGVSYTFTVTPQSNIPQFSALSFTFPSSVTLQSGLVQVSCSATISGTTTVVTATPLTSSPLSFILTTLFNNKGYTADGSSFTVTCTNMQNPRNLIATSSFTVSVADQNNCAIASINSGLSVQMSTVPSFNVISVTSDNPYNGFNANYLIEITPAIDMINNDVFYITFPSEITLPSSPTCSVSLMLSSATCTSPSSNKLKVVLKFTSSPLSAGTKFSFKIASVKNAASTKISSDFTLIEAQDSAGNQIAAYTGTAPTVKNLSPAPASGSLQQYDTGVSVPTDYTITYTTQNTMPAGSTFQITYPTNVGAPTSFTACQAIVNNVAYVMTCTVDTSQRLIKMTGSALLVPVSSNTKVQLKISPMTNPDTQLQGQTLTMTSYTDSTQLYSIDKVSSGLIPAYKCDFPCASCPTATQKSTCLSCFSTIATVQEKYLNGTKCLTKCPDGYYNDNYVCKKCPAECLTCNDDQTCKTCDISDTSQFKYFNNSRCFAQCPDTYYGDSSFICARCESNCLTCNRTATNCTSCKQSGDFPLLSKNQCVAKCDAGWVSVNYVCQQCKAPCGTCIATVDSCTSCKTGFLLGTKCYDSCPSGYTTDNKKCIGCDPKCDQCSPTNATRCLQCLKPLVLLNNTCISKCPDGYKSDALGVNCLLIINNGGTGGGGSGGSGGSGSGGYGSENEYNSNAQNASAYFSTQIAQVVLGGVAVGSRFKDPSSSWQSNTVGLWGPIEMISFGGQLYLSYDQLNSLEKNNLTASNTTATKRRNLLEIGQALTSVTDSIVPLVFYGTVFSVMVKILCNFFFCIFFLIILRKDAGYQEFVQTHKCHPWSVVIFSTLFSFKLHKFLYSRFMGLDRFYIPFENPERIHSFFNTLTTLNIILSLVPVILIDVYGLAKYQWGSQFYVMMIETLIFSFSMIIVQVLEYRAHKTFNPYLDDYSQVKDNSLAIEDEVRRRLGEAMDEYARRLKKQKKQEEDDGKLKPRRTASMCDIGDRNREEDPRRIDTEPLDAKRKKRYEDRMNPYHQVLDNDFPDNCYAEVGRNLKSNDGYGKGIVQQTGQRIMSAEEYDRDLDSRMRMMSAANMRGDQRLYGMPGDEVDDEYYHGQKKKKNMRGRKGKYYSQVDDEDQTFLEQERRLVETGGAVDEEDEDEDERDLGMIEEESNHSTQRKHSEEDTKLLSSKNAKTPGKPSPRELQQLENQILKEQATTSPRLTKVIEEQKARAIPEEDAEHLLEEEDPQTLKKQSPRVEPVRQSQGVQLHQTDEHADEDDDVMNDKEAVLNQRVRKELGKADIDGTYPQFKSTEDMRREIEFMSRKLEEENKLNDGSDSTSGMESEKGQVDSDDDEIARLENMRDPERRKFNVNDILGDFDRDERGHPLILQDKKGDLIDKDGHRVNEKGYLVDPKTGDIVEKAQGRKIFSAEELDDRGELPPPFNLERYNFNGHDVRGYFDRDSNHNDILNNLKRDKQGFFIDKLGRRVNEHGYLMDMYGNLTDKRLRTKLHKHIMEQNSGDLPQLFTYKGKKFDLLDVLGTLDKDRKGNIIIRRDAKGNMVDKKGRPVNAKGYLVDKDGNVVNEEGRVMFEQYTLSKDGEIPKLFSFLKFNIEEVRGDYEMDPLGNPMLQKTREGYLVDSKGRRVNSKGYLVDEQGNIVNKRKQKVFSKRLLEEDGEVPKVFRAGLLRKDTYDSFSQLMSEIEDLERLQEMEESAQQDPALQAKIKRRMEKENERLQKKIDKIVEGDGEEDDGMLMKELEELANGNAQKKERLSDGGNTSVDSMMEDTPSNYNALNQRFMEVEAVKQQARKNLRGQQQVMENEDEEEDGSEYSYLPDRKMRKKKKKKKKKKRADGTIDERELMMAKAYGGLSQSQYDKLVALKKLQGAQLPGAARVDRVESRGQMMGMERTPSNLQTMAAQHRFSRAQNNMETASRFNEDQRSDWGESQGPDGRAVAYNGRKPTAGGQGSGSRMRQHQGNSTSRMVIANKPTFKNNNLMSGATHKSMAGDGSEHVSDNGGQIPGGFNRQARSKPMLENEQRLADVANSVSGFYKDPHHAANMSEHGGSNMSRTQDNFASNLGGARRASGMHDPNITVSPRDEGNQDHYQRVYGTANRGQFRSRGGPGGQDDLSDEAWERASHRSGRSQVSQFSQVNAMKVKGLETIYLQRLEPAAKKKGKPPAGSEKAKFRIMHHKYHDEPEWHVEDRDELDSIISGNYKEMQKKFEEEFQGSSHGTRSRKAKRIVQKSSSNAFQGNMQKYKK